MGPEEAREEAWDGEGDEGAKSGVDDGGDEEVRVEVDSFEAAFVFEDVGEGMDGAGVGAVAGEEGLDDEPGADEVEGGEEEAGDEVGGDGEEDWGLVEGRYGGEENGLEEVLEKGLEGGGKDVGCARRQ
jgi:hypothetical protein